MSNPTATVDIVERLRHLAKLLGFDLTATLNEAADEIEQLRRPAQPSPLNDALKVIRAEPCPFKEGPMADGWAEAWATFLNRLGDADGTNELYANSIPAQVMPGLKPTEAMVLAGGDVLLAACSSDKGNLRPWKPFDVAQVAIKVWTAMCAASTVTAGERE